MNRAKRPLVGMGIGIGAFFLFGSSAAMGEIGTALSLGVAFGVTLGLRPRGEDDG